MKYFLIGYMGCGKTTIGREVARKSGISFVDMDHEIERLAGKTITRIFEEDGETCFREMESGLIKELGSREGTMVISTGGGAPCFGDNIGLMNGYGETIYLKMSPEKLMGRLGGGRAKRPMLRDKGREEIVDFINNHLQEREPYYMQAKMVINCDGVNDTYICEHIMDHIAHTNG